jgi:hypothetical protein
MKACINKSTRFYQILQEKFDTKQIAQITDKLNSKEFNDWYGEDTPRTTYQDPILIDDTYIENNKGERITLFELLNNEKALEKENFLKDKTYVDSIRQFLKEERVALLTRINMFKGSDYAKNLEDLLSKIDSINENDYTNALNEHVDYILKTVEELKNRFIRYDDIDLSKLTKEQLIKRQKDHNNFLRHANNFITTFEKINKIQTSQNANKELNKVIKKLREAEEKVGVVKNRIVEDIEKSVLNNLKKFSTNPLIVQGVMDFFASQVDETKIQLYLDSIGDSNNVFLSTIYKFYKKTMYDKDKEVKNKLLEWEKLVNEIGDFDNFIKKVTIKNEEGNNTDRFIQKYDIKYEEEYFKLLENLKDLRNLGKQYKLDDKGKRHLTNEYKEALNSYFNFKKENSEQQFIKEYYETLNNLHPKAREIKESIDIERNLINKKREEDKTEKDFERLQELEKEYKNLKSSVSPDGTKKEGEDLEISKSIYNYTKNVSKFYETVSIDYKGFNKAKNEALEKGEEFLKDFLIKNTKEQFIPEVDKYFKDLFKLIPKSIKIEELDNEINQLLINYKNEKGEVIIEKVPENIYKEYLILEEKRKIEKTKFNKTIPLKDRVKFQKDFKRYFKIESTNEYKKDIETKLKQLENNEISQEDYNFWFNEIHEENIFTGEKTPIKLYTKIIPRNPKGIEVLPNNKWKKTKIKEEFINKNFTVNSYTGYPNPTKEWLNKDYEKLSEKEKEQLKKVQDFIFYLVNHLKTSAIHRGYFPQIIKDIKKSKKENIKKDKNNLKNITETEEIVKFIPLKYVQLITKIPTKELSIGMSEEEVEKIKKETEEIRRENEKYRKENVNLDLKNTVKVFINIALTHKYKKNIENEMLLAKEQLKQMKVKVTDAKGNTIGDKIKSITTGNFVEYEVSAKGSNLENHFNQWLDSVFYEDFELDEGYLSDITKPLEAITSFRNLGFNPFSGINNKLMGNIQARIESAGGIYYNYSDYRKARKDYMRNSLNFFSNRDKKTSDNYIDAYLKEFDILVSQEELGQETSGTLKSILEKAKSFKNTAYLMQHLGEHQVQNATLLAMSNSHRIINGKILNFNEFFESFKNKIIYDKNASKEEKENQLKKIEENNKLKEEKLQEFENYPSILESFELKEGFAKLKEDIKLEEDELFKFKERVLGVNQRLHGIYNTEDAAVLQRYAIGRLAMQFRKWMRPGWNRRFGAKFGKGFYNEKVRDYEEGMYITTFKFLSSPFIENYKDYKNNKNEAADNAFKAILDGFNDLLFNSKIRWHSLSEIEKANIKKTAIEFAFLLSSISLAFLAVKLKGDDDEDDNKLLTYVLSQSNRLIGELSTYNFGVLNEGGRLVTSPVAVLGTLGDVAKLGKNLILYPIRDEDERVYKSGIYHGQDKVFINTLELLPITKQIQSYIYMGDRNERYNFIK